MENRKRYNDTGSRARSQAVHQVKHGYSAEALSFLTTNVKRSSQAPKYILCQTRGRVLCPRYAHMATC